MRLLAIATAAAAVSVTKALAAADAGSIQPLPNFPITTYNPNLQVYEVQFQFLLPVSLREGISSIKLDLYQSGCQVAGDDSVFPISRGLFQESYASNSTLFLEPTNTTNISSSNDTLYQVSIGVNETSIATSDYYIASEGGTAANIDFCFILELFRADRAVATHETAVQLRTDLLAGFDESLDGEGTTAGTFTLPVILTPEGVILQLEDTEVDVEIFHCDANSTRIDSRAFGIAQVLQVCVQANAASAADGWYVTDILQLDLDQPDNVLSSPPHADVITDFVANELSEKTCQSKICNIQAVLQSKWFSGFSDTPPPLNLAGIATVVRGEVPNTGGNRRRRLLSVPLSANARRRAQDTDISATAVERDFAMPVSLYVEPADNESGTVLLGGATIVAAGVGGCCCLALCLLARRRRKEEECEEEEEVNIKSSTFQQHPQHQQQPYAMQYWMPTTMMQLSQPAAQ